MKLLRFPFRLGMGVAAAWAVTSLPAADLSPRPPVITGLALATNGQQQLTFTPFPATEEFQVWSASNAAVPFTLNATGAVSDYAWTGPVTGPAQFHQVRAVTLDTNALLAATMLQRLTYGPTPDELERIATIGPQAYLAEQLRPEALEETLDVEVGDTNIAWVNVVTTGTTTSTNVFIYLNREGRVKIDEVRLVMGTELNGVDLLNGAGSFDTSLSPPWLVSSNFVNSSLSTNAYLGAGSLQLVGTAAGAGNGNSIQIPFFRAVAATQQVTLSFWYLPDPDASNNLTLTVRLSGSSTVGTANVRPPTLPTPPSTIYARLTNGVANIEDLRAWHAVHAVRAKRQLSEVLLQFWDNHFNTQYDKTREWFDNNYARAITNAARRAWMSVDFEFQELQQWRKVLLDPNGTFLDLLRISAFSPAMVIYLDSVLSSKGTPNENYPRELLELFAMGADNGYTQDDINEVSKAWTGYRVAKKAPELAGDVFANPVADPTNSPGVFVLHFSTNSHHTGVKRIFTNHVVEARFGAPYAGRTYSLTLSNGIGTNGFRDAVQVVDHVANLPYTQEFISVKLCQLFVHENFEYGVYDYTASDLSPEVALIRDCMRTWREPGPDGRPGNLRAVLGTIFGSELFRGHSASRQKVKTPFEFAVAAVRALRARTGENKYTCDTDGYGLTGVANSASPLSRMGGMALFNRVEPDGWPEFGRLWLNTANLCERMRFCEHLLMPAGAPTKATDYGNAGLRNVSDPVGLLKLKLAPERLTDAGAVVDYFLSVLYPGEGKANVTSHRAAAIEFLNSDEARPPAPSPFRAMSVGSLAYDGRVRGMVALLMTFPRFQEQ